MQMFDLLERETGQNLSSYHSISICFFSRKSSVLLQGLYITRILHQLCNEHPSISVTIQILNFLSHQGQLVCIKFRQNRRLNPYRSQKNAYGQLHCSTQSPDNTNEDTFQYQYDFFQQKDIIASILLTKGRNISQPNSPTAVEFIHVYFKGEVKHFNDTIS